jgi:hypothetical protein
MGNEITREEEAAAHAARLVVVFGYSDDCVELRGAFHDEIGACGGRVAKLDEKGLLPTWDDGDKKTQEEAREFFRRESTPSKTLIVEWDKDGYSWVCHIDAPFAAFDVMEDSEKFCRGLVFSLSDIWMGKK